ncbi:MAG: threonine synthase [Deltaproteobacteria bacterium]
MRDKFKYKCIDCGAEYNNASIIYLCPVCSSSNHDNTPPKGVLKVIYDYVRIKKQISSFAILKENRFLGLMPYDKHESLPDLRIGNTPLYRISSLDGEKIGSSLFLKDDSQNPTYSFKDRASAVVSAYAKEKGISTIVAASTGNAGSSLAGLCASQGQRSVILVPETAPVAKLTQIIMYGAVLIPVIGSYDDAFDLSIKATVEYGWYNRNTAFNPLTIEGKKTVAFELYEQLGHSIPDRVFVPVGDGCIISGVYKGFEDMLMLGIIEKIPIIVMVQSEKSDNLIRNLDTSEFKINKATTIADSISVDIPRNFYMTRHFVNEYNGEYLTVSDDDIIEASKILSRNTGLFSEPAACAAFAGVLSYKKLNKLTDGSKNVVLLTGSGLKDLNSVKNVLNMPESVEPDIKNLKNLIS